MPVPVWGKARPVPSIESPPERAAGHRAESALLGAITLHVEQSVNHGYAHNESGLRTAGWLPVGGSLLHLPQGVQRAVPSQSAGLFLNAVRPTGLFLHLAKRRAGR
jgi:hypothetical protein